MRTLLFAAVWLMATALTHAAQNPAFSYPEADRNGERFLFIVDLSENMEDLQAENESALYELIGGGIFGQMRTGDTFGLWTFNSEAFPGRFSMKVWDQKRAIQQGTVAAAFISSQTYEKSSNIKEVMKQLKPVIHSVSNLNIFIISDGRSGMSGTPLDKAIIADYKARKSDRRRAKKPFITSLVAREGWIVSHQVVVAGEPIRLPERRQPPRPVNAAVRPAPNPGAAVVPSIFMTNAPKKMVILTKTNTPAAVPATTAVVTPPPVPETNVIVVVTPTASAAVATPAVPPATNAPAAAPTSAAPAQVTAQASSLAPPGEAVSPSNKTEPAVASTALTPSTKPVESSTSANPSASQAAATPVPSSVIESVLAKVQPSPVRVAAREPGAASETPSSGSATALGQVMPGPGRSFGNWWMALGGFLAGATVLLVFSVLRRGRVPAGPSLITRSMDRR
jgi:hypothetical protein